MLEEQESNTKKVSEPEEGHSEEEKEDRTIEEDKAASADEDDEPERTDSEPEDRKKAKSIDVWECKNDFQSDFSAIWRNKNQEVPETKVKGREVPDKLLDF